jgi:exopolyphosphatase/guanosine-5'-triphosphate,3'-diphosphate pyrophosphatase
VVASFLAPLDGIDLGQVILCAGTARAVRSLARALGLVPAEGPGSDRVGRDTLRDVIERLAPLPLAARRSTPGLDPNRADLIVHGALMLDAILASVGVEHARVCRAALREGLILEQAVSLSRLRERAGVRASRLRQRARKIAVGAGSSP